MDENPNFSMPKGKIKAVNPFVNVGYRFLGIR